MAWCTAVFARRDYRALRSRCSLVVIRAWLVSTIFPTFRFSVSLARPSGRLTGCVSCQNSKSCGLLNVVWRYADLIGLQSWWHLTLLLLNLVWIHFVTSSCQLAVNYQYSYVIAVWQSWKLTVCMTQKMEKNYSLTTEQDVMVADMKKTHQFCFCRVLLIVGT